MKTRSSVHPAERPVPPSVLRLAVPLLAAAFLSALPARAANFTLTAAMTAAGSYFDFTGATVAGVPNTLGPGDTLFIEGATRASLTLKGVRQGTAGNPITITNTGGQFILDNTTSAGIGLRLRGCQFVVLKGTPSPGNYDYGIKIANTSSNAMGLTIQDDYATPTSVPSTDIEVYNLEIANAGFAGIFAKCDAATPFVMQNLKIHHNYIHHSGGEAMYIGWTDYTVVATRHEIRNVEIRDNLIVNAGWDGIQLNGATQNASIHHNTIIGYGVNSHTADVPNNHSYWQNEGIICGAGSVVNIHDNWIENVGYGGGAGIFAYPHDTVTFANNVIIQNGDPTYPYTEPGIYVSNDPSSSTGFTVKLLNNTIVTTYGPGIDFRVTKGTGLFVNNLIAAPRASQPYVALAGGTSVTQTTHLHTATVAAAGFVDATNGDYALAGTSAAVDAGTSTAAHGVTTDFAGASRPQGSAYDIGAYEYLPPATTIITPGAWGQAGTLYCPAAGAFNEQPTWDAVNLRPIGSAASAHVATGTDNANRCFYVDFGANYAKVRLTGMWTRYRPYSGGNHGGFGAMWWDNDTDAVNDGTTVIGLNFGSTQGLANVGTQEWARDVDLSASPVTPANRYLIINTGSAPTTRANEFAFTGYIVP